MKLKHLKTSLLASTLIVSALSLSSISLTACGSTSGEVVIADTDKTQQLDSDGSAIYTFTLAEDGTSTSDYIVAIEESQLSLSASIYSVEGKTLKIKVSLASTASNTSSYTFSLKISKADGSWSKTISGLTLTTDAETYSVTYTSVSGITFTRKPTYVVKGSDLNINYTISNGYELDTVNTTVSVGGTVLDKTAYELTTYSLTIPAEVITGNIVITIKTESSTYASYSITYNSPTGLTWTTQPSSAVDGKAVLIQYTLSSGYAIDTTNSDITVGGTSIKSSITYNSGTINIPGSYITGDVVISIITKTAATYSVTYNTPSGLTWISKPSTATSGAVFTATYSLTSGKAIDEENSTITINGTNQTEHVTFGNGTIIIAADYVTGPIVFNLIITDEKDTHTATISGGEITSKTSEGLTTYTITPEQEGGTVTATLSKKWLNSSIKIASPGIYNITLDNCTISNLADTIPAKAAAAPINITKKAKGAIVNLILADNSENSINDKRTITTSGYYDDDYVIRHNSEDGTGSLNVKGFGVLNINNINNNKGVYTKAIQTKTDMTISENATINAFAYDNAIQVGGALTIDNANVIADSYYGDGIKTKSLDPSDDLVWTGTRNINRNITVIGSSNVTIYAARHGFNAAHNFVTKNDGNSPTIKVYTGYANAGSKVTPNDSLDEQNLYIAVTGSAMNYSDIQNYYFTIDFYESEESTEILSTEVLTLKKIMKNNEYYFFKTDRPLSSKYGWFKINRYAKSEFGSSSPSASSSSDFIEISSPASTSTKDCVKVTNLKTSTMSCSKLEYNYNYLKDKQSGETIDTVISSKGIKANNLVSLPTGYITLNTQDTCISCGYGDIFCNSDSEGDVTFGSGDIVLSGADITGASSSGDGVKAYGYMNVSSGNITITKSVEALEAGEINLSGGLIKLSASDDGMNASECGTYYTDKVKISISGGILDVQTTNKQDTDAVDSNNTLSITGGLIIARVPGGNPSTSLDWETGDVSISGATIVLMGEADTKTGDKELKGGTVYDSTQCSGYKNMNTKGSHTITYYETSTKTATYIYTNSMEMNGTKTVISNFSCPSFK